MAPSLTDGVPGLEGVHTLTPPSPFPAIDLNAYDPIDTGSFDQAFARLSEIVGIHDKPDADDPRVNLVYQIGELPLPRLQRGRSITYNGIVYGRTLSEMRAMVAAIRALCANASNNPTAWQLDVAYDPTYDTTGLVFSAYGIPIGFTCDDKQGSPDVTPSPYNRAFTLTFRQSDGRWWITPDDFLCSVGSADSPIADGTAGVLTMTGTASSEPVFTVYGSGSGESTVTITAAELGAQLTIDLPNALNSGDALVVDFGQRTITYTPSGGDPVDWTGYLDWANTNWWNEADTAATLLIGTNTLTVAGDTWACTAIPAVW